MSRLVVTVVATTRTALAGDLLAGDLLASDLLAGHRAGVAAISGRSRQ